MIKIYKLAGEEPVIGEFIEEAGFDTIIKNPLIPRMRAIGGGKVGLTWMPFVQFCQNILETMKRVKLPTNLIMWESIPADEVCDSYNTAIATIEATVEKKILEDNCYGGNSTATTKLN